MFKSLSPTLKKITVPALKLVLDPNNPRFTTRKEDQIQEKDILDADRFGRISKKFSNSGGKDRYNIKQLENSIKTNGWQPVDFMFVKRHSDNDHFIVLEGNRRLSAIINILEDENSDSILKKELEHIDVMEVLDDNSPTELQRKISYLLGVRHHGSLVKWSPFAQAHNIYLRYTELSGQTSTSFQWDNNIGRQVADTLSIPLKSVEDRLRVYRSMEQLSNYDVIKNGEGSIKARYYSVCAALLLSKNKKINEYIKQSSDKFLVDEEDLSKFDNLCHFSSKNREGAPIKNPQEWRYFDKILKEQDTEIRNKMVSDVEQDKILPSLVYSKRAEELKKLQWDKWLLKVTSVLKTVTLGDDLSSEDAISTVGKLVFITDELEKRDNEGGDNV